MLNKTILAIDTAMNGCSVALYDKARDQYFVRSHGMVRGHAELLMPMIEGVMNEANLDYKAVKCIVVTIGPGAFTGLRIGISAAKSLALVLNVPVVGLSTLDVLARQYFADHDKPCAILVETKRDDYYVRFYNRAGEPISDACTMNAAAIAGKLDESIVVVGDAVSRFALGYPDAKTFPIELPDPKIMCAMADEGLGGEAEPLYLRGADVTTPKRPPRILAMT